MSVQWGCDSSFFYIFTFLYFYISIFLHFYIYFYIWSHIVKKPRSQQAASVSVFTTLWNGKGLVCTSWIVKQDATPFQIVQSLLGGKDVDGGNGYQRDQGVWIKAGKSYCSLGRDWKTPISMTKDPNELESLMHVCWSGGQKGLCILSEEHKDSSQLIRSWTFNCSVCSAASVEEDCILEYIRIK